MLVGGLAVRLYGLRHGLPYSYHSDEALHFTNRAVAMFEDGLNPHYFQNPSGYTYLVHAALRIVGFSDIVTQFREDPTDIYMVARYVAVALAMLAVVGAFAVGRRLWGDLEGNRRGSDPQLRLPPGRLLPLRGHGRRPLCCLWWSRCTP